jgi:prolyl oligopeptidase
MWLVDFDRFLKSGAIDKKIVSVGVPGQAQGTVIDGTLFIQTTKGAPRGRIVATSAAQPEQAHWRDIVPERADAIIDSVSFGKNLIAVTYLKNAANVVEVFDLSGKSLGAVSQPGIGAAGVSAELDRTEAFLTFTSFNHPTTIFRIDLAKPGTAPELWERPDVPVDPAIVDVEQVWYPSKDGTRISMFLVHKKGLERNGATPTLLTGYGGFNVSETPAFSATLFQWFEAGGLYAVPNLRGGGEYGDAWHEAGVLDKKQNVFDDFIAAAEWLIANRYTNPQKLAISGASNGGLLTGAAITQRPELFRAAIVGVPLLDMLRYHLFGSGKTWVPEYGSAEDDAQFKALFQYSPYRVAVDAGARGYPAVLFDSADHDDRVDPMHARKLAAVLQAAQTGDAPILLRIERNAGHGGADLVKQQVERSADQLAFLETLLR